jgi:hypothetical protein
VKAKRVRREAGLPHDWTSGSTGGQQRRFLRLTRDRLPGDRMFDDAAAEAYVAIV